MSTLKTTSITHGSNSGTANMVLAADGKVTIPTQKLYCPGTIIQVLQTVKTDTATYGTAAWADISGLSQAITPSAVTSKFKVSTDLQIGADAYGLAVHLRLARTVGGSTTAIGVGDAASNRTQCFWGTEEFGRSTTPPYQMESMSFCFLDDPDTTSAITYKVQWFVGTDNAYLNRTGGDSDSANYPRGASTIMVEEVAA